MVGPIVAAICEPCGFIRIPYEGPGAAEAIERWRQEQGGDSMAG